MTRRTDAFTALRQLIEQAVQQHAELAAWDETPRVEMRPANEPLAVPEQSLIVIRDLGVTTPIEEIGRGTGKNIRECTARAMVEAYVRDQTAMDRDTALEGLMLYIGEMIELDPTFNTAIDDSDIEEADLDSFGDEGQDTIAGAAITVTMTWYADRALG